MRTWERLIGIAKRDLARAPKSWVVVEIVDHEDNVSYWHPEKKGRKATGFTDGVLLEIRDAERVKEYLEMCGRLRDREVRVEFLRVDDVFGWDDEYIHAYPKE